MNKLSFEIIPTESSRPSSWMTWVNGLMIFLAVFFLSTSLSFQTIVGFWENTHQNGFTIEIPPSDSPQEDIHSISVQKKIFDVLRKIPAIKNFQALNKSSIHSTTDFLKNDIPSTTPTPVIIDVEIHPTMTLDVEKLRTDLHLFSPGIEITKTREWHTGLMHIANIVFSLSVFLTIIVCFITIAIIMFSTFTGLAIHQKIVRILIQLGATRLFIAKQFQKHALQTISISSLMGIGFYILSAVILFIVSLQYEFGALFTILPIFSILIVLVVVPLVLSFLALLMSHITVYVSVRKYGLC